MEDSIPQIIRALVALAFVLCLMGGLSLLLKKLGLSGISPTNTGKAKRLQLIETLPLDARRKIALIQRDDQQHLIILGGNTETVIETGIKPVNNDSDD